MGRPANLLGKMSCDIEIEFDRNNHHHFINGRVSGRVIITPYEDIDVDNVTIDLLWKSSGKGTNEEESVEKDNHPSLGEKWVEGNCYTIPFNFTLPSRPMTYDGRNIRIDFNINVKVLKERNVPFPPRYSIIKEQAKKIIVIDDANKKRMLSIKKKPVENYWTKYL